MIYLDNAATTRPFPEVIQAMNEVLAEYYGNPSSTYTLGRMAKQKLNEARVILANSIGAQTDEIILTSGGTESNNTALYALAKQGNKKHIISTLIEHPSVLNVLHDLETQGYRVTYLQPNDAGCISVEQVANALQEDTAFVSIMAVNNETGAIQPIAEIGKLLKEKSVYFHVDAVQAYGVLPFSMSEQFIDMLSVSAHKIHGPKGIGFLYVRQRTPFHALLKGGGQESERRSGTENLPAIVGFATAVALTQPSEKMQYFIHLQQAFIDLMDKSGIAYQVNSSLDITTHLPKVVNIWLKNIASSKLLIQCDLKGIMLSAGSACSAGSLQPSRVLETIFQDKQRASESIRISFSTETTVNELKTLVETLKGFTV